MGINSIWIKRGGPQKHEHSRYFNTTQALAYYAEVLIYKKKQLLAQNSPIIVVGASYGGSKLPCQVLNLNVIYKMS